MSPLLPRYVPGVGGPWFTLTGALFFIPLANAANTAFVYFEDGAQFDSHRDRSVYINGYDYIYLSAACQISNFLFLMKILHITRKQTISLTVGLVLHDRNPFYAKKEAISK